MYIFSYNSAILKYLFKYINSGLITMNRQQYLKDKRTKDNKTVFNTHKKIKRELIRILNKSSTYIYNAHVKNSKDDKGIKHFPAVYIPIYDDFKKWRLYKKRKGSFSLSSKPIIEQLNILKNTAIRRCNLTECVYNPDSNYPSHIGDMEIMCPLTEQYSLMKYDTIKKIYKKFPSFIKKGASIYNCIYTIRTENMINYIDPRSNMTCDTILICLKDNIINVMFESSKDNPLSRVDESFIKAQYENTDV